MDVGDVLAGRYELLDQIGVGGMGRVLRARDRTLDRLVAVKLLAPHLLGDQDAVAALREEARRAAAVRHPNVVQVLDAVLDDTDQPAIVMEHVDGPSLADVLPSGGMPVDDALAILGAVGAGLAAVHAAGLVHRDVTPGNVLLDDGVPRLTDFGIARSATATATQTVRGSVGYLAPEQASGQRVGPAADVYALGCLATTLLTGHPPFAADTPVGVVHQHLHEAPPDLLERRADVPAGVAAIVRQALAKDPAERPSSVAAMLQQLGLDTAAPVVRTAAAAPTTVLPARSRTRTLDDADPPPGTPQAAPPPTAGRPSRTVLAVLGVLAVLVVLAAAAAGTVLLNRDQVPQVVASPSTIATPDPTTAPRPSPTPTPTPTPSATAPASPTEAARTGLQDLRALLLDLRGEGEMSEETLDKLDDKAAEAAEKLGEGDPDEAAKKLRELGRELDQRVEKEEVTAAAGDAIRTQLAEVEQALDAVPDADQRGRGDGQDRDDDEDEDDRDDD